jgi:uncharacterized membrane protein
MTNDATPRPPDQIREAEAERGIVLERVIFFSDAVFAIAITLLVLDVRLPDLIANTNAALIRSLVEEGASLAAFALSFAVIAAFWIGHMRTFRAVVRTDPRFIALNLLFLAFIALLPFPTSVLARYGDLTAAAVFYGIYALITALLSTLLWVYAASIGHLLSPAVTPDIARFVTYRAAAVPLVFAISIPIALLVGPFAAELVWVLAFPIQALITRRFPLERAIELSLGQGRQRDLAGGVRRAATRNVRSIGRRSATQPERRRAGRRSRS